MAKGSILNVLEKQLAHLLKCRLLPEKTYLAGGTAVYFYLNHRVSIDLDFFTPTPFNSVLLVHKIKECFDHVHVELMEEKTVILYVSKEKVKFSLFLFPYENLQENQPVTLADGTICPLASLEDIEAMKAVAISQRGSVKDFVDMYFLLAKTGHHFKNILGAVIKKYGLDYNYEYQLKTSLVYFEDAENEVDNIIMINADKKKENLEKKEWRKIKKFFQGFIR
jgi:predicted nucleotidyltransferase component of viral defense system